MLPVSAMSISCFIDTGYRAKAIFISPLSTLCCNSSSPRIPPTKSIRLSERKSFIPKISLRIRSEDIVTSSIPMGSLSSYVPSFAVKEYHFPSIYREKLCSFFGLYICTPFSSTMKFSFSFSRNS